MPSSFSGNISKAPFPVSIITPVFNTPPEQLRELFDSIEKQTLSQWEWILVNDGSTEAATLEAMAGFAAGKERVRVIDHPENKGLPAARNTGIKNSSGDYLFFIDSDDLADTTLLEKSYLFLNANREFAFVNSFVKGFGAMEYLWPGGFHEGAHFLKDNRNTSCFMARRSVFEHLLFDETMTRGCEDWDFWLHAASKGFWGYTIPEYLFHYRRSDGNRWQTMEGKTSREATKKMLEERYAGLSEKNFPAPSFTPYSTGYVSPEIKLPSAAPNNLHLLCLVPWLEIGGSDQYNLNLFKGLKEKGWQITIVTTEKSNHPLEEQFRQITTDIFHLANLAPAHEHSSLLAHLFKSRGCHKLFLSNSMYGYYALPFLKQAIPSLVTADYLHIEDMGWHNGGFPFFSVINSAAIDHTFASSAALHNWCVERGMPAEKISVCYINVDTEKNKRNAVSRERLRKEAGLKEGVPVLVYVARLTQQKQPGVLVETLHLLKKKGVDFNCLIIGDGPDRKELLRDIDRHRLNGQVRYLGSRSNEEVLKWMDAADIFFLPSLFEGIALSIYEAMAKGLAIIGAEVGGQAELVTPDCGILVRHSTPRQEAAEYAEVLSSLIREPERVSQMGSNAAARVNAFFRLEQMVSQVDSFYRKAAPAGTVHFLPEHYLRMMNEVWALKMENSRMKKELGSRLVQAVTKYKRFLKRGKKL